MELELELHPRYPQLRFHEITKDLQDQCNGLQRTSNLLNQQMREREAEFTQSEEVRKERRWGRECVSGVLLQNLNTAREKVGCLEQECSNLSQELKVVKTQVLEGNYRVENFDSVKRCVWDGALCVSIGCVVDAGREMLCGAGGRNCRTRCPVWRLRTDSPPKSWTDSPRRCVLLVQSHGSHCVCVLW